MIKISIPFSNVIDVLPDVETFLIRTYDSRIPLFPYRDPNFDRHLHLYINWLKQNKLVADFEYRTNEGHNYKLYDLLKQRRDNGS